MIGFVRDGAAGLLQLRRKHWHTIAQDESSSIVYGMPRAAAEIGAAAGRSVILRRRGPVVKSVWRMAPGLHQRNL